MKKEPQDKTKKEKVQNKKIESKKEIKEKQDGEAENKKTEKEEKMNKGFFKKIWYSINKIEKYPELSAEGLGRAIIYLMTLVLIIGAISSFATVYRTSLKVKEVAKYIDEKIPELTYKEDTLQVGAEEAIIDENENFGKIIVDTKTDDEQQINQYIEETSDEENAVIILKNKLMLKQSGTNGTTDYNYKDLFGQMGITEFNKQSLLDYLNGNGIMNLYFSLFASLLIYSFVIYLINLLFYIIIISIFGYLATMILKLKIRYVAIFNMAIYAITLPALLNIIYIAVNAFYPYQISYFEVLYALIASIYIMAAIFILKTEFNKKQGEVQKIVEVEKQIKEENKEEKREKPESKKDKKKKEEQNKEQEEKDNDGEEPEGSNA